MATRKSNDSLTSDNAGGGKEKLKWETAKELGLDDDLAAGGDELTVKEAGKIGGNMVKKLIEKGENELAKEDPT